jgi:hypothetical protein
MAVTCKPTVRLGGVTQPLVRIFYALCLLDEDPVDGQPEDLVITSLNDSTHAKMSKHYVNQAADVRSKSFRDEKAKAAFVSQLKATLGPGFTVLYEMPGGDSEHFHVQRARQ